MTDEELAEEYAKLNARQYIHNDGIGFCTSEEEVRQAYLAGLKTGKDMNVSTEWHDLRKGPQNLPPLDVGSDYLSKNVLLDTGVIGCYNYSQKKWCVDMGYRLDKPVIAWCEIPKYTEE